MHRPERYIDIPFVDLCSYVFDNPNYDLDKPVYIDANDDTQWLSYCRSRSYVRKLIAGLKARGLQPGDSVCLHSFNSIWFSILLLSVIGARGRFVGSNPAYTSYELTHLFTVTKTKYLIVDPAQLERVRPAARACDIPDSHILIFNTYGDLKVENFESWRTLLDHGEEDWYRFDNEHEAKTTAAMLASTSGTTGLPKAAMLPHHSFVAMDRQTNDSKDKPYEIRRLLCLAQFHLFPTPLAHVAPLKDGHTTYIMKRWDLAHYIEYVDRYRITETAIVTPIVLALLALDPAAKKKLTCLRSLQAAGAPLGRDDQNALRELCHPQARFTQIWGLTETGWITMLHYPEDDYTASVGRLLPSMEAKIVDESGTELTAEDATGEVLIRGPSLMLGYLDNLEATQATIGDGWLHTGDVGFQRNGKWYIVDRLKELIKVRGWQVSPSELEKCLLMHPAIWDAAVIGIDFKDGRGELPRAYIALTSPDTMVTNEEILAFMGARLATYKALLGGIVRINAIPRNPSGKILKRILRERAVKELRGEDLQNDALTIESEKLPARAMYEAERPGIRIAV